MNQYNALLLAHLNRKKEFIELGSTDYFTWESLAETSVRNWLYTKVGRADYATIKNLDPAIKEVAERLIKDGLTDCADDYKPYLDAIRADEDPLIPKDETVKNALSSGLFFS